MKWHTPGMLRNKHTSVKWHTSVLTLRVKWNKHTHQSQLTTGEKILQNKKWQSDYFL